MTGVRIALAILLGIGACATACDSIGDDDAAPRVSSSTAPSSAPLIPTLAGLPAPPPGVPDVKVLLESLPGRGSKHVGVATVQRGRTLWVALDCVGKGIVKISYQVGTVDIPCLADAITPSLNQFRLDFPPTMTFSVDSPPEVTWSMRVMQ